MKNNFTTIFAISVATFSLFFITSCQTDNDNIIEENSKSALRLDSSNPNGKTMAEWAKEYWLAGLKLDCVGFNTDQALPLNKKVVGLWASLSSKNVYFTVARDKAVFFPIITSLIDYPCPSEYGFEPAPGQSLEDFLEESAAAMIDDAENLKVVIDGVSLENLEKYRYKTEVFYFTANPELICVDPCLTPFPQPGAVDGYYVMLNELTPGKHTILMSGAIPSSHFKWKTTFYITVQ